MLSDTTAGEGGDALGSGILLRSGDNKGASTMISCDLEGFNVLLSRTGIGTASVRRIG